jgi:hypothetical protein
MIHVKQKWKINLQVAPMGANRFDVRLATQVQARTQQRAAATGQLIHCLLVVTHRRNLAGLCKPRQGQTATLLTNAAFNTFFGDF